MLSNDDDVAGGQPPGATQEIETYRGGNSYTLYKSDQNPLNFARCVSGFKIVQPKILSDKHLFNCNFSLELFTLVVERLSAGVVV